MKTPGDRCGCPDDRCIGYHHYEDADCWCLLSRETGMVREWLTPGLTTRQVQTMARRARRWNWNVNNRH